MRWHFTARWDQRTNGERAIKTETMGENAHNNYISHLASNLTISLLFSNRKT